MFNLKEENSIDEYENYILMYQLGYQDGIDDKDDIIEEKKTKKAKKDKAINEHKTWRNDYETYRKNLADAYMALIKNEEWLKRKEEEFPNVDIIKTIRKSCSDYWITEAGWKNKKRKRIVNIDWLSTFNNCLDMKRNRVYKDVVIKTYSEEANSKVKARGVL